MSWHSYYCLPTQSCHVWAKTPTTCYVVLMSNLATTVNLHPVIRLAGDSVDCARLDKLVSPGQNWREASVA